MEIKIQSKSLSLATVIHHLELYTIKMATQSRQIKLKMQPDHLTLETLPTEVAF